MKKKFMNARVLRVIVLCIIVFEILVNSFFSQNVIANLLNPSQDEQAYPILGKYWFANVFTENNLDPPAFPEYPNKIQAKMDCWHRLGNDDPEFSRGQNAFNIVNWTTEFGEFRGAGIYSPSWLKGYTWNNQSFLYIAESYPYKRYSYECTFVRGGYKIDDYNSSYYRIGSNITAYYSGTWDYTQYFNIDDNIFYYSNTYMDHTNTSFETIIAQYFNVSTNLLLSKSDLSAIMLNGTNEYPIDNPLFFNRTILQSMNLNDELALNGLTYKLTNKTDAYYKMETTLEYPDLHVTNSYWDSYPTAYWNLGLINKTYSIYIKPTGEIWCYEVHRYYRDLVCDIHSLPIGNNPEIITEDRIQLWFGWHYYEPGPYFNYPEPRPFFGLRDLIPFLIGIAIVVVVIWKKKSKSKSKKKNGVSQNEPKLG